MREDNVSREVGLIARLVRWAKVIKQDVVALWIAGRDRRVAWYAKLAALFVAAYALSPIDLIPDFIPILGYLDDVILVPLGILLVVKMIPLHLMKAFRVAADQRAERPVSRTAVVLIVAIWCIVPGALLWAFWPDPDNDHRRLCERRGRLQGTAAGTMGW